jgi:predicted MFS family arabinose efflux permease
MIKGKNYPGAVVLCINHLAGFVDLVILPIWVGVLVQNYKNDPQQAGGIVSLFLVGQVVASIIVSPRYDRIVNRRMAAALGFLLGAICMFISSQAESFIVLAALHFIAGLTVGSALSLTHGTIGRSENPHRLFAIASLSLGTFAILFYVVVNPLIIKFGGKLLFQFITGLNLLAAVSSLLFFPSYEKTARLQEYEAARVNNGGGHARIPLMAWFTIAGLMGMAMVTAMASAFYERLGIASGYSPERVNLILLINGILLLTPSIFAAILQKFLRVRTVAMAGIIFQALVVIIIYTSSNFWQYSLVAWGLGFAAVFTHTFLFGYLAHMDPSGRVVAANPAIIMTGSMLGPFIGGTLVTNFGYHAIAYFVVVWNALILFICFRRITEFSLQPEVNETDQNPLTGS